MLSPPLSSQFRFALVILKCVFCLLGTVGNVVVFIYQAFVNRGKSPNSYFVANLVLADLIVCLTVYPAWISDSVLIIGRVESDPKILCRFSYVIGSLSLALSALALLGCHVRSIYLYSQTSTLFTNNDSEENFYNTCLCMDLVFGNDIGIIVKGSLERKRKVLLNTLHMGRTCGDYCFC